MTAVPSGTLLKLAAAQPVDLRAGAAVAFDPVRAGDGDQHALGVMRAEPRHVGRQRSAGRSLGGMLVALMLALGVLHRGQELGARLIVVAAETAGRVHEGAYRVGKSPVN